MLIYTLEDTTVYYPNIAVAMEQCINVMKDHHQPGHAWLQWEVDQKDLHSKFSILIMKTMKSIMIALNMVGLKQKILQFHQEDRQ